MRVPKCKLLTPCPSSPLHFTSPLVPVSFLSAMSNGLMTLEEFENQLDSQIEVSDDHYGPWMMRVHMRRWRYQQLFPHLPLAKPDQAMTITDGDIATIFSCFNHPIISSSFPWAGTCAGSLGLFGLQKGRW